MINSKNLQEWENALNEEIECSGYKYITKYVNWKYKLNVFESGCKKMQLWHQTWTSHSSFLGFFHPIIWLIHFESLSTCKIIWHFFFSPTSIVFEEMILNLKRISFKQNDSWLYKDMYGKENHSSHLYTTSKINK